MKKGKKLLTAILAVVLIAALFIIGREFYENWKGQQASEEAIELAGLDTEEQEPSQEQEGDPYPPPVTELMGMDLEALREVNEDVTGWITIPGTELSYPILDGDDNQYYLNRNWKREYNGGGSIFLEATSSPDFSAFHTILYGHRMRNDSMFGSLRYYQDQSYWDEHPDIYVVLQDGSVHRYRIFSAHRVSVRGLIYRLDLKESQLEQDFLDACMENSTITADTVPTAEDQILTLSTCTGNGYANRWVIHGVLEDSYFKTE